MGFSSLSVSSTPNGCAELNVTSSIVSGSYDHTLRVWDAKTGEELLCAHDLPRSEWATTKPAPFDSAMGAGMRPLVVSAGAWRYLAWRHFDEKARSWIVEPAEAYGPLPVVESTPST